MLNEIKTELISNINRDIVNEIFEHYDVLKTSFRLQDWEKCLLRGGKFSEAVMKAIHLIHTGNTVTKISVEAEINEVNKRTDLPDSIRLLIPRAIKVIYDHRSKRGGAHSSFDPNSMDCSMIVPISDWIIGELVRLYCTSEPNLAMKFVAGITVKSAPFVEKFGKDYIVLLKGASARQEIALILYTRHPNRTKTNDLIKWIPNHSASNIRLSLANMRKAKLAHFNSNGYVFTTLGIKTTEEEIFTHLT